MNTIIIELCAEDRARLDRLTEALENLHLPTARADIAPETPEQVTIDDVQQKLADTLARVNETPVEETPAEIAITEADLRSLIRELIGAGKKTEAKNIVNEHAPSVTDIPADAIPIVYEKLKALKEV